MRRATLPYSWVWKVLKKLKNLGKTWIPQISMPDNTEDSQFSLYSRFSPGLQYDFPWLGPHECHSSWHRIGTAVTRMHPTTYMLVLYYLGMDHKGLLAPRFSTRCGKNGKLPQINRNVHNVASHFIPQYELSYYAHPDHISGFFAPLKETVNVPSKHQDLWMHRMRPC